MFVKYTMTDPADYRGIVKLVASDGAGNEVAYTAMEDGPEAGQTLLTEAEIQYVKDNTDGQWNPIQVDYQKNIDDKADDVRNSYLHVGYNTISLEYEQVETRLKAWREGGSILEDVPDDVLVWAEATGNTIEWAANDIAQTVYMFREVIRLIRRARLIGKAQVAAAPLNEAKAVYEATMANLEAMRNPETM